MHHPVSCWLHRVRSEFQYVSLSLSNVSTGDNIAYNMI